MQFRYLCFLLRVGLILAIMPLFATAEPISDQEWQDATLSSNTLTISCSEFKLPIDLGRILAEVDPINSRSGEMSQSMSSAFPIKVSLQPESGTSDNLDTISGCAVSGTELYIAMADSADSVTFTNSGNVDPPGAATSIVLSGNDTVLHFVLKSSTWYLVGGTGSGGGLSKTITDATNQASGLSVGDGTSALILWCTGGTCTLKCDTGSGPCDPVSVIPTDTTWLLYDEEGARNIIEVDPDATTPTVKVNDPVDSPTCGASVSSSPATVATTCTYQGIFYNGTNSAKEFDLPAAASGKLYCFKSGIYAQVLTISPDASDAIVLGGTAASAGEAIVSSGAAGESICVHGQSDSTWQTWGASGTWAESSP
jgi:hypothetical protein